MSAEIDILVTVGTDYHRFDRLIDWVDDWVADWESDLNCLVQHGRSRAPRLCGGAPFLSGDELSTALADASVVVCHGGPATIAESRASGRVPICVPRDPARGEHVDGHQQRFARRIAQEGIVLLAEDERALRAALIQGVTDPNMFLVRNQDVMAPRSEQTVSKVGELISELLDNRG